MDIMDLMDINLFSNIKDRNITLPSRNSRHKLVTDKCQNESVNRDIKEKLKNLIRKYPNGLWCCELAEKFEEEYHSELTFNEFGYTNLIQMLSELTDVFRCVRPGSGDWLLFDASVPPSVNDLTFNKLTLKCDEDSYPKGVMRLGEKLVHINLKDIELLKNHVEICVAEVWSPSRFYINFKKFSKCLSSFMNDLQVFYNLRLREFKMPDWAIRPKQICVGYYSADCSTPEEWHRVEIIKLLGTKSVFVHLIDFGTATTLKKSHLRFLHRTFQFFPVQALLAKLAYVAPMKSNSNWPASACAKFLQLIRIPNIEADIIDIDYTKPQLNLVLYNTSENACKTINEQLVEENLAESIL